MTEDTEIQHAKVAVTVAVPVTAGKDSEDREATVNRVVRSALKRATDLEFRTLVDSELRFTETHEQAGERRMAEAEAREERRLEKAAERYYERRGGAW